MDRFTQEPKTALFFLTSMQRIGYEKHKAGQVLFQTKVRLMSVFCRI